MAKGNGKAQGSIREWVVDTPHPETGLLDRDSVISSMVECESIGNRIGGEFLLKPIREDLGGGRYETVGWAFCWRSFSPPLQRIQSVPAQEPVEAHSEPQDAPDEALSA